MRNALVIKHIRAYTVEIMVGGGVVLAAFNYFIKPGFDGICLDDWRVCGTDIPALYFVSVVMITLGVAIHYHKRGTSLG